MGLRLRLILVLMIPLTLVIGVYGFVRIRQEQEQLLDEDRRHIGLAAKAIQIAVENALRDRQVSDVQRLLLEIVEYQEQIDRIRIFNRQLTPFIVSNRLPIGDEVPVHALRRVIDLGVAEALYQQRNGEPVLYYLVPIRGRGETPQAVMEIVHLATAVRNRAWTSQRDVWVRLAVLVASVAALTGLMLQRQVLRPLSQLMDGIRRLGHGQTGPPLHIERRDELGRVAAAFNEMAERLDAARARLVAESDRALDLEQQLRRVETLAVAGKLATGFAHEVGTPLNIICGRAEFLLQTLPVDDPRRRDLVGIIDQIDRISGIIRSMLDIVRPRKPELQPVALPEVLQRLLPLIGHAAKRRRVTLLTSIPGNLPTIHADPNQLQQVLINLLINALEAARPDGEIRLAARVSDRETERGVAITVTDTGPGIPSDLLPRVFEPFFTTKPPGQGTGLGLAICRDILKEHGGDIRVESSQNGTTFVVWLPQAE